MLLFFEKLMLKTISGLTLFGARHYCHIVFVCSCARAHIFGGKTAQRANISRSASCVSPEYLYLIARSIISLLEYKALHLLIKT